MKFPAILFHISCCLLMIHPLTGQQDAGHFKFGLVSFESSDSTSSLMNDMIFAHFKEQSEYDLYFNEEKSVTLIERKEVVYRLVYHEPSLLTYSFLDSPQGKYYSIDSSALQLKTAHDQYALEHADRMAEENARAMDSLSRFITVSRSPGDMKSILGFSCVKSEIRNPRDPDHIFSIVYSTDRIPIPDEAFGAMSSYFPGCSLETTILMEGMTIVTGALSFEPVIRDKQVFSLKTKKYKLVSHDEMETLLAQY
jgi:hypothetical protein